MVTGKQVYDLALVLIDEVTELGGLTPDTPKYYESKAKHIINMLQAELTAGNAEINIISDLSQTLSIPDKVALTALPYGVASQLMLNEDQGMASYFNARFDELKPKRAASIQPITDTQNILNGMR